MIVDAGIGLPSHACQVMEWGFDGVLLTTVVSRAIRPVRMAYIFLGSESRSGRFSGWSNDAAGICGGKLPGHWRSVLIGQY
jgi:thiazole synthase ThiGH ThiG subunit